MNVLPGFTFTPPRDYRVEEAMVSWRGPSLGGFTPSFIAQSKKARLGATLEELTGETIADLSQALGNGLKDLTKAEFHFEDGGTGMLLSFNLTTRTGRFRQYFVLRQRGDRLCTLTVTVPSTAFDEKGAATLLASIASLTPS